MRIRIFRELRVLGLVKTPGTRSLCQTGQKLLDGTEIEVGDPQMFFYDHTILAAVSFTIGSETRYILERDYDPTHYMCAGERIAETESTS